jgi:1A family penicillin-binding protein
MQFIVHISATLILFFILLGDSIWSLFIAILRRIRSLFLTATLLTKKLLRSTRKISRSLRFPAIRLSSHKKTKKKKPIVIFPLPFWIKLRYFFIGTIFSILFICLPLVVFLFLQDLPHPRELTTRQIPQTTKIYDRNGVLLHEIYASQNRTLVPLSAIPKHLEQATLAIEDKNFYKHPGFDLSSILRALMENTSRQTIAQGGSTLTQQLIKSSMLTPEQQISRKIKEVVLAFWAERIYTKEQILEMYFNQIPYGGTAWGIEAAAEVYFNKTVDKLTLAESAFLAGITQAPTTYSPYSNNPDLWKNRQKEVLGRMVALGYISQKQADQATQERLLFKQPQVAFKAPHFVNYVRDLLVKKYGLAMVEKGGLIVRTSLDLQLQNEVQEIVREEVAIASSLNVSNGAAVVTDPKNGDILAMVGSQNFNDPNGGNVNLATSLRQPGSTVKVITYTAALANGHTAASILDDSPASFPVQGGPTYTPVNYDGRYRGRLPIRLALANSLNLPAVKLLQQIGVKTMVDMGQDMGITHWDDEGNYGLAITLGGSEVTMLDMATVNGTLATMGKRITLNPIQKITNYKNETLEEKRQVTGPQVLDEGVAFIISDILADNASRSMAFGLSSPLHIPGHTVSVKTGTSDNKRDNWTVGYNQDYVVTVWVGNNDNSPMSPNLASGVTGAAPIWNRVMTQLLTDNPDKKYSLPENVVRLPCFNKTEYFIKGTENQGNCRYSNFPTRLAR